MIPQTKPKCRKSDKSIGHGDAAATGTAEETKDVSVADAFQDGLTATEGAGQAETADQGVGAYVEDVCQETGTVLKIICN